MNSLEINKLTSTPLVSPGAKHIETKLIKLKEIYIPRNADNKTINMARAKDLNQEHINKIATSLKNGIDYSKMLPAVIKSNKWEDGVHYEYILIAGAHRYASMEQMNITEWLFDVYELSSIEAKDLSLGIFQIRENNHKPQMENSADDLINILSRLINKNLLANNQTAIEKFLSEHATNLHKGTFQKVVSSVVRQNGAYQDFRTFPMESLKKFIEGHSDYSYGGDYDTERNEFGFTVKEGYEDEYLSNALKRLAVSDKGSYFICHTKAPTEQRDVNTRRSDMVKTFEQLEQGIEKAVEIKKTTGQWPWRIEKFLGQDVKNKEKNFLSVDEAISKRVLQKKSLKKKFI